MLRSLLCGVFCLLTISHTIEAVADDQALADAVWQSIQTQREMAAKGEIPTAIKLEYTVEWHFPIGAEELVALRSRVAGKPDHPDRVEIENYEQYIANGPRRHAVRLWIVPEGLCRYSVDYLYGDKAFQDSAVGEAASWMLSARSLTIAGPDGAGAPVSRNPAQLASCGTADAVAILYGPYTLGADTPTQRSSLRVHGDKWSLDVPHAVAGSVRVEGFWDDRHRIAIPASAVLSSNTAPPRKLAEVRAKWQFAEAAGRWIPTTLEWEMGPHQYRVILVQKAESTTLNETAMMTAVPDLNQADPVRGVLTVGSMSDFRSRSGGAGPTVSTGAIGEIPSKGLLKRLQWLIFGTALSLILLLVCTRWYRGRVSTQ